ncbi:MAG: STAS domain-containing protein [Acidiphilium sp.]
MATQSCDAAFVLPAVLDLKAASPLAASLLARRGADIEIDGSAVERLGGQCLQVLLAARASWVADGQDFVVGALTQPVAATLALLGVSVAGLQYRKEAVL